MSKFSLINQSSIIVLCPRAGLSMQTIFHCKHSILHSTLFSASLFISSDSPFIMLSIIWYLLLLPQTFFPFTIPPRSSYSRQFLLSHWPSKFLFLFFISSSIILPSLTLSSTTAFFNSSVHFTRSIFLHTHISNYSSHFCSFRRSVQVSATYNATLHTKHFTSLFRSSFPKDQQKMLLFLLRDSFAIAILCFIYWQQFILLLILHPKYLKLSICSTDSIFFGFLPMTMAFVLVILIVSP